MYDTIGLKLDADHAPGIDFISEIPLRLDMVSAETNFKNGTVVITGYLGAAKIQISKDWVKFTDTSLCKWYLGDNFKVLSRPDVERAIKKLNTQLGLPMDQAMVTRIDVAQNIIVRYDKWVYYNHLGGLGHFKRLTQPDGIYYQTSKIQAVFYDKVAEQKRKRKPIPEIYKDQNVIRYELRFKRDLLKIFNRPSLTAADLYDPGFYVQVVGLWLEYYRKIKKINDIQIDWGMIKTVRELNNQGILCLVDLIGGEMAAINKINEDCKCGKLKSYQALDLRERIKTACRSDKLTTTSDVILELSKKIQQSVSRYQ